MTTATPITLKSVKAPIGSKERMLVLAEELGVEPEEGQDNWELAEMILAAADVKDDAEYKTLSQDLQKWANAVNTVKRAERDRREAAAKAAGAAGGDAPKTTTKKGAAKATTKPAAPKATTKPAAGKATTKPAAAAPKAGNSKGTKPAAATTPAKAPAGKAPSKEELAAMKAAAKKKASEAGPRKQVVNPESFYRPNTTAWHVVQIVKEAGKTGVTMAEAIEKFEKRITKFKLQTDNPAGRVKVIIGQATRIKGMAERKDDRYYPTKKLIQSE